MSRLKPSHPGASQSSSNPSAELPAVVGKRRLQRTHPPSRWESRVQRRGSSCRAVAAHRKEALLFDGFELHGLPITSRNSTPPCRARPSGPIGRCAGEGSLLLAEQGGRGAVTVQGRAVDLDQPALHLMPRSLQLEHAARQVRLAGAGGAGQQDGRVRAHRHSFDLFDHGVEAVWA